MFSTIPADIAIVMGAVAANCVDRMFHAAYRGLREAAEGTEQEKQRRQAYETATLAMLAELYRRVQGVEFKTVAPSFEEFFATPDVAEALLAVAREGSYLEAEWLTTRFHEVATRTRSSRAGQVCGAGGFPLTPCGNDIGRAGMTLGGRE